MATHTSLAWAQRTCVASLGPPWPQAQEQAWQVRMHTFGSATVGGGVRLSVTFTPVAMILINLDVP